MRRDRMVSAFFGTSLLIASCSATEIPQAPDLAPPASAGHNLVYSPDLEMVLLVNAGLGGMTKPASSTRGRIWGWNGTTWIVVDSAGPPIRNLAGVTYDVARKTLVMHGGSYDLGQSYGETWEWTAAGGWHRFPGSGPGVRDHTQLAYDEDRHRAVLFGGSGTDPNVALPDTWEFDGTKWERVATAGPPPRVHHAMQYDRALGKVVVFGGFTPGASDRGDTWAWDGSIWTSIGGAVTPRTHARMTFHPGLNALVMVGGFSTGTVSTLVRSSTGWTPLPASPEPSARYLTDVAYDAKRGVLVLFGGGDPAGSALYADTWEFDGSTWARRK